MKIRNNKVQLAQHKQYFNRFANDHKLAVVALLIPSFIAGWESGKRIHLKQWLRQMSRVGLSTAVTSVRKLYLGI
ncbi:hypothetical protein [Legionella gresilensis]|uniref:hypothetical protein n=1 Tax=Legionella gresilensis TaxID=91823 RepID=UPI00104140A8|nr:hypothetical protein [Legionella gresilensis]